MSGAIPHASKLLFSPLALMFTISLELRNCSRSLPISAAHRPLEFLRSSFCISLLILAILQASALFLQTFRAFMIKRALLLQLLGSCPSQLNRFRNRSVDVSAFLLQAFCCLHGNYAGLQCVCVFLLVSWIPPFGSQSPFHPQLSASMHWRSHTNSDSSIVGGHIYRVCRLCILDPNASSQNPTVPPSSLTCCLQTTAFQSPAVATR